MGDSLSGYLSIPRQFVWKKLDCGTDSFRLTMALVVCVSQFNSLAGKTILHTLDLNPFLRAYLVASRPTHPARMAYLAKAKDGGRDLGVYN